MSDVKERKIRILITVVSVLLLSFSVIRLLFQIINITVVSIDNNISNEIRDYVSFRLTRYILDGVNPYQVDFLNVPKVPFVFSYPGLNALIVAVVCRVTGMSIIAGNYTVNIITVLLTTVILCLLTKDVIKGSKVTGFISIAVNTATFFSLFGVPFFNQHTDSLGILFFSFIMLCVYKNPKKTLIPSILTVFLIFTKQIMAVMALPLFVYYLILDRKSGLRYFLQCAVTGILTVAVVQLLFPLFWTQTIYTIFAINDDYGDYIWSLINILSFYGRYVMYLLASVLSVCCLLYIRKKEDPGSSVFKRIKAFIKKADYELYLVLNLVFGTLFLIYFAKCGIDGFKYCQDMLAPSLFVLSVFLWNGRLGSSVKDNELTRALIASMLCLMSFVTLFFFDDDIYHKEDVENYTRLETLIGEYADQDIFLGTNATGYLLNENIWDGDNIWFDDGQIGFINGDMISNKLFYAVFYGEEVWNAGNSYAFEVNTKVRNGEFALIITSFDEIIDDQILEQNYYIYDVIGLKTDQHDIVDVTIWLRR